MYIVNDPYLGGTHLMDVRFAKPYYRGDGLWCWLSNTGHWPDTGGAVPGGFSASATAVEQEGLRLPPVKLFKRGTMDAEIWAIVRSNIRVADQRIGDVAAQAAALEVGAERLDALLDRYGDDTVEACIGELADRAETRMRACIETVPEGHLARARAHRQRRRRERAAGDPARAHAPRRRLARLRLRRLLRAVRRADELGARHDPELGLPRVCATSFPRCR